MLKRNFIITTLIIFATDPSLSKDSLLTDTKDYRLYYVGANPSKEQLKSKFVAYTTFVNIAIDSSFYIPEYPIPFSPSMVKNKFLYHSTDTTDIKISIVNRQDSILFKLKLPNQVAGYYYLLIKDEYFLDPSINRKIFVSDENIRIIFLIKEEEFTFSIRN